MRSMTGQVKLPTPRPKASGKAILSVQLRRNGLNGNMFRNFGRKVSR